MTTNFDEIKNIIRESFIKDELKFTEADVEQAAQQSMAAVDDNDDHLKGTARRIASRPVQALQGGISL